MEELKPNGSNIPVTSSNRIEYIHLVADYKLNKQIRLQCNAFRQVFYAYYYVTILILLLVFFLNITGIGKRDRSGVVANV